MSESVKEDVESLGLMDMLDVLEADVVTAQNSLRADSSQYQRRVFVRALFAMIEAMTYLLKQVCLYPSERRKIYSFEEIALLKEETYVLDGRAKASSQPKFLPTDSNFRFAINLYARDSDPGFTLNSP